MKNLKLVLSELGLSPTEQEVYIAMQSGLSKVSDIQKNTAIKRPTIYYALKQLEHLGLVVKKNINQVNRYSLGPIDQLQNLLDRKRENLDSVSEKITEIVNATKAPENVHSVSVTHFETLESVKQAIMYSLYCKEKTIRTIVPTKNFFRNIGDSFSGKYVLQKKKNGVTTKALWQQIPTQDFLKAYYDKLRVQQLPDPPPFRFETTTFIYDNKVLYIYPSMKKPHAILIESFEQANLMKSLFESIYNK